MKYLGRIDDPKDLVTKEYVDKGDVFIAIYGETTYSQVADARTAGKIILAASPTYDSVHVFNADIAGEEFSFTMPSGNNYVSVWSLEDNDNWTSSQVDFGTTDSFYTTSSTTAATAAKTTETVSGYTLRAGNIISVKFTNANTANAPTLKVGSTRAKAIWYKGAITSASNQLLWNAEDIVTFVYNGSIYEAISINTRALTDVTFVEYGVTSATEVYNAQGNGKLVIAFDRNDVQRCAPLVKYSVGQYFYFSYVDEDGDVVVWTLADNGGTTWAKHLYSYVPTSRTVNSKALSSDITLTASDVGALASDGIAERSRRLQENDSRSVNDTPANLISDPGMGVFSDFKSTSVINTGETPTKGFYQVISFVPWVNDTGGLPVQLALANKAGTPLMYVRSASSTSAWGSWNKLATISDIESAIGAAISRSY